MMRLVAILLVLGACAQPALETASRAAADAHPRAYAEKRLYFPDRGDAWERRRPEEVGVDAVRLREAVEFARTNEIPWLRNMRAQVARNVAEEPYPAIVGPVRDRAGPSGIVLRHGYIVAEWGDTKRVDMTFSVAKSYLSAIAGLALDSGLIRSVHDPVRMYVDDGGFEGEHNAQITWHQLLNQTSEWEGTLWDKPDLADRREGRDRKLQEPGTFWEYNDVRVNRLALALLHVWRRPLPEVLKDKIMDPIGTSSTWEWHGYRNSYVAIGGRRVQSVSGGGHWGGVWASTLDHARFGYLFLRRGRWEDRQLLSERWIRIATTPTTLKPTYGYMWWLNTDRAMFPSASAQSFFALGAGGNVIWVDPEHDLVAVVRWIDRDKIDEFMRRVTAAVVSTQ